MRKKFFVGDKLNDLIVECAQFICDKKIEEFHVYTFKRMNATELNPRYILYVWYSVYPKEG